MAVTFDFGTCPACGESNSKTLQACRACHAALPWAKNGKNAPVSPPRPASATLPRATPSQSGAPNPGAPPSGPLQSGGWQPGDAQPKPKMGLGNVAYGAIAVQIFGGLVFLAGAFLWLGNIVGFYRTFPGAGYITLIIGGVIWRAGLEMD